MNTLKFLLFYKGSVLGSHCNFSGRKNSTIATGVKNKTEVNANPGPEELQV